MKCAVPASLKALFFFIISLIVLSSCGGGERTDLQVLDKLNGSLESSAKNILYNSEVIYHSLEDRLQNPQMRQRALVWEPKAIYIKAKTAQVIAYIDSLKNVLNNQAGNDKRLNEDRQDIVYDIFYQEKQGYKLYTNLSEYKNYVLNSDPEIERVFADTFPVSLPSENNGDSGLYNTFFKNTSLMSAIAVLNSFEVNIRNAENETITFCHNQIPSLDGCGFIDKINFLIAQNVNHIKSGEEIEISAGIGLFSVSAQPKISINGKNIKCEDGVANYKFKGSNKPGKYYVPVKIEYVKPDGTKEQTKKTIEYTVDE